MNRLLTIGLIVVGGIWLYRRMTTDTSKVKPEQKEYVDLLNQKMEAEHNGDFEKAEIIGVQLDQIVETMQT